MAESLKIHAENGQMADEERLRAIHDGLGAEYARTEPATMGEHPEHDPTLGDYLREHRKAIGAGVIAAVAIGAGAYGTYRKFRRPPHNID